MIFCACCTLVAVHFICYNVTKKRKHGGDARVTLSDAKRRANKKWNSENLTSFCVKLNKEKTEKFRRAAAANNTTPSAVIREAIENYIRDNETE